MSGPGRQIRALGAGQGAREELCHFSHSCTRDISTLTAPMTVAALHRLPLSLLPEPVIASDNF